MSHQTVVKINQSPCKSSAGEDREEHQPPWVLQAQLLVDDSSDPLLTTAATPLLTEKGQTPGLQMRGDQKARDACSRNGYDVSH